jgi:hypothetical protein
MDYGKIEVSAELVNETDKALGHHKSEIVHASTFSDLVATVDAKIVDLPALWTDEQVAATLGIAAIARATQ